MNKQIILYVLLSASMITHGMKRKNDCQNNNPQNTQTTFLNNDPFIIFANNDHLPLLTQSLCMTNRYQPGGIRTDIKKLSCTNKLLHDYYGKEQTKQEIISLCLAHNNSTYRITARALKCHAIYNKIKRFTHIALNRDTFSEEDAKDPWYLNITTSYSHIILKRKTNQPLLYIAIDHFNLNAANFIMEHTKKINFYYKQHQSLLLILAETRHAVKIYNRNDDHTKLNNYLAIAEQLLKREILPDGRENNTQQTPLMHAVMRKDKDLARLLLEYGADPYAEQTYIVTQDDINMAELNGIEPLPCLGEAQQNVFDIANGKKWFQIMLDEVAKEKQLKIAHSQTDQSVLT